MQSQDLPVDFRLDELDYILQQHQVVILQGETGSGKSTKVPPFLHQRGYASHGMIACTQPRRIAASSLSKWVATVLHEEVGDMIGYSVRFDKRTSHDTKVKYLTDGMLLREAIADPLLKAYAVVIIDEVHERNPITDMLLGLLKGLLTMRPELKVLIMSATIPGSYFQDFFDAQTYKIEGRKYAVSIIHSQYPADDYIDAAVEKVIEIHTTMPDGDILVFLTGQAEINECANALQAKAEHLQCNLMLMVMPLYAALDNEEQKFVLQKLPSNQRKCIIATNIAETSLTIEGIVYVVDCGYHKQDFYDPWECGDCLRVSPISKQMAHQRAGRAGRTCPGYCYRLYTKSAFDELCPQSDIPGIQRGDFCSALLQLKALGVQSITQFDWLDPPTTDHVLKALEILHLLDAIDTEGCLTPLGKRLHAFPMCPQLAVSLLKSGHHGSSWEMHIIASMLESDAHLHALEPHLQHPMGDHFTLLHIWECTKNLDVPELKKFAENRGISLTGLLQARQIRSQLQKLLAREGIPYHIATCQHREKVVMALLQGSMLNVAKICTDSTPFRYTIIATDKVACLHPTSTLQRKCKSRPPKWVVFNHAIIGKSEMYMYCVSAIPQQITQGEWFKDTVARICPDAERTSLASVQAERILQSEGWSPYDPINPRGQTHPIQPGYAKRREGLRSTADDYIEYNPNFGLMGWDEAPQHNPYQQLIAPNPDPDLQPLSARTSITSSTSPSPIPISPIPIPVSPIHISSNSLSPIPVSPASHSPDPSTNPTSPIPTECSEDSSPSVLGDKKMVLSFKKVALRDMGQDVVTLNSEDWPALPVKKPAPKGKKRR